MMPHNDLSKTSKDTPWEESGRVMVEADELEELIKLHMENLGMTREKALAWALEMREVYRPKANPCASDGVTKEILMPNGCILTPGGRIRMTRKQAFEIPTYVIEAHGLELDDKAASEDTEVVVWPIRAPDGDNELPLNKESHNEAKSSSME